MDCHTYTYIYIYTNHRSLCLKGETTLFRIAIINHFTNKITSISAGCTLSKVVVLTKVADLAMRQWSKSQQPPLVIILVNEPFAT